MPGVAAGSHSDTLRARTCAVRISIRPACPSCTLPILLLARRSPSPFHRALRRAGFPIARIVFVLYPRFRSLGGPCDIGELKLLNITQYALRAKC
jgi:hypothetical protein